MSNFLAGFADLDYTPELGLVLRGQQYRRVAERVRDPLMINAAAFRSGEETVVVISIDICFVPSAFTAEVQQRFEQRTGIPGSRLLIHTTHSHVAPAAVSYHWGESDPRFVERLKEQVVETAENALAKLEPVSVHSGSRKLDVLNWNRRAMYEDGSSVMHGKANRPGFISSEKTRDPNFSVVFARSTEGRVTGAIVNYGTHPNCVENERYYSADLPGEIRCLLKLMLGPETVIVYLTGAAGNVAPIIMEPFTPVQPWMGEEGLKRAGLYLAGEAAAIIASAVDPIDKAVLEIEHAAPQIPLRPFAKTGERCYPDYWTDESKAYYQGEEADWPRRLREESPVEVRVNVVRIGDTVICTNPAELFSDFALQIREASPARVTLISQLTDGYVGYIPTPFAFTRGGYETWPCQTSKLSPEAGDELVEATRGLLERAYGKIAR
jgi:hypothetical protein